MSEKLVRKVVVAALKGEIGDGGWIKVDAGRASDKELSLAIMEANDRGLVRACDVSNHDSQYPEWRLTGPTGASRGFIEQTRLSKKVLAVIVAVTLAIVAFFAWLIPVLVSLWKR